MLGYRSTWGVSWTGAENYPATNCQATSQAVMTSPGVTYMHRLPSEMPCVTRATSRSTPVRLQGCERGR
jgi:hypothetical protein